MSQPVLDELAVADDPAAWRECGFAVDGDLCVVGETAIRIAGGAGETGMRGWSLRGVAAGDIDGLATSASTEPPPPADGHPNGVAAVDHVVVVTPDLERTVGALEAARFELRRIREEPTPAGAPRQAFFRLGSPLLEVVQEPAEVIERAGGDHPAFFWGIALLAPDLEATVAAIGPDRVSEVRDAVQPGRRIATLRRAAGLALPVALISGLEEI